MASALDPNLGGEGEFLVADVQSAVKALAQPAAVNASEIATMRVDSGSRVMCERSVWAALPTSSAGSPVSTSTRSLIPSK